MANSQGGKRGGEAFVPSDFFPDLREPGPGAVVAPAGPREDPPEAIAAGWELWADACRQIAAGPAGAARVVFPVAEAGD